MIEWLAAYLIEVGTVDDPRNWIVVAVFVVAMVGPLLAHVIARRVSMRRHERRRPRRHTTPRLHRPTEQLTTGEIEMRLALERDPDTTPDTRGLPIYRGDPL